MARYFRERGHILRFIEYMDVGHTNGWRMDDVVPGGRDRRRESTPRCRSSASRRTYPGEVADRWAYRDGGGEVGVIASVTQPFCADCTRARLTADGQLYTCLFASTGHDLRGAAALGRHGCGAGSRDQRRLARARRPLLGAAHARDRQPDASCR